MQKLAEILRHRKFAVLDGAFATELEALGININDPLWSALALIDKEDMIAKVHLSYLKAGADIITSSSYQATVSGFMKKNISKERAVDLIAKSVRIAKQARDSFIKTEDFLNSDRAVPQVAASLGPYGAYLADGSEYRGDYKAGFDDLKSFHKERIEIISKEKPDLYALETVPVLSEALAVSELLNEMNLQTPMWISFSCCDGEHISDGTGISECGRKLDALENVAAVGINCTQPKYIESLVKNLRAVTRKAIIVYPNSGEQYDPVTKTWSGSSEEFLSSVMKWYAAGANIIGGCCRTTPADIKKIASMAAL